MPPAPSERFTRAIQAIDAANADDPHMVVVDGVVMPKEVAHAQAMTRWVQRLDPDADEAQLLAARAHHLRRWTYPRSEEPEGRAGYLRWRSEAKRRQARSVAELLTDAGYDDDTVGRVRGLVAKDGLGRGDLPDVDGRAPAVQTHEDALCLVLLTTQFEQLAEQLGDDKMVAVLVRTLAKMGRRGREAALALPLEGRQARLVADAVARIAEAAAAQVGGTTDALVAAGTESPVEDQARQPARQPEPGR